MDNKIICDKCNQIISNFDCERCGDRLVTSNSTHCKYCCRNFGGMVAFKRHRIGGYRLNSYCGTTDELNRRSIYYNLKTAKWGLSYKGTKGGPNAA